MNEPGSIRFMDCNCVIGGRQILHAGSFTGAGELARKMAYYGIDGAMAHHSLAAGYDAAEGNRILGVEIAAYPQFQKVWVVMPHHTGEFPAPDILRGEMKENNVRLVKYLPDEKNFSAWYAGELFAMLEACRVPIMIRLAQFASNFDTLHDLLETHPDLRVILTELHYNTGRYLYPLVKKFPHLYIETIGYKIYGGIEDFCEKFGAGNLVFGSCAPIYSGGSATGMVRYAQISDADKRAIACGNLEKLLGEVAL